MAALFSGAVEYLSSARKATPIRFALDWMVCASASALFENAFALFVGSLVAVTFASWKALRSCVNAETTPLWIFAPFLTFGAPTALIWLTIVSVEWTTSVRKPTSFVFAVGMSTLPVALRSLSVWLSFEVWVFTVFSHVTTEPQNTWTHFSGVEFRVAPAAALLSTRTSSNEAVTAKDLVVVLKRFLSSLPAGRCAALPA